MALSSPGIGSGLDVNGLVGQLMAVERRPLNALDTKEAQYQTQLTAYGSLKGALSSFQSAVTALSNPDKFSAVNANITDPKVATVTASSAATAACSSRGRISTKGRATTRRRGDRRATNTRRRRGPPRGGRRLRSRTHAKGSAGARDASTHRSFK